MCIRDRLRPLARMKLTVLTTTSIRFFICRLLAHGVSWCTMQCTAAKGHDKPSWFCFLSINQRHHAPSVATDTSFSNFSFDLSIQTGKKGGRPTFWRQRWSLSAPACGFVKLNAREKNSNLSELLKQKCCKMNKTTYFITNFWNFR